MRPRDLPKLRDQMLRHLADPESPIRAHTGEHNQPGLDTLTGHLRHAELYVVTADMTALAMSAGEQLDTARWATADRPADCGLIAWQDGIGTLPVGEVELPIDAMTWGPHAGECVVWPMVTRRRLAAEMTARGSAYTLADSAPPLIPSISTRLPVTTDAVPLAEVEPAFAQPVVAALAAAWLLMEQPQLVDRTREQADRAQRRNAAREGRPDPSVTVVDLRRQYVPQDRDPGGEGGDRRYRHRWVVSGHWRQQPHGPGREQRRKQWIPAHIKGPDGAPMLATERVNVWRR